jgi:hypothetical protein
MILPKDKNMVPKNSGNFKKAKTKQNLDTK